MLRLFNLLLIGVAVFALGLAWWVVGRSTPKTSGSIASPVGAEIAIVRDKLGIPHITAKTIEDVLFAQGFVTAQDRLWQMDMLRRSAAGELSEIAGPVTLELDTIARKLRMRRIANKMLAALNADERRLLAVYARGVNHYIETNHGKWGPEFTLMGYEPRPWTVTDTLLAVLQMNRTLSSTWDDDLLRFRMVADGGADASKVRRVFPVRSGGEIIPGSNSWAISGNHTATGKPILASDPHLEYTMPATWYLVHLKAADLNVIGASLPGVPFVMIGHNERIAWGITSLQFDAQDLYIEKIDPRTARYAYKGQILAAQRETELIAVKGQRPAQVLNLITQHGPIFTADGNDQLALRWAAAEFSDVRLPILSLNRAANWSEFRAALAQFPGPGLNFIYADRDGNIGHQVVGRLPLRNGFTGEFPMSGDSGAFEWSGAIPFEQLPSYFNPAAGRVISANQNPFPESAPYMVSGSFSAAFRQRQIDARLRGKEKWQPQEMLSIQTDVYSSFARYLAQSAISAAERKGVAKSAPVSDAVAMLKSWNGLVDRTLAAPVLCDRLYQEVRRRIALSAAPKAGVNYRFETAAGAVESLLRERPSGWFDDWDQMLVESLSEAWDAARRQNGNNPERWQWGNVHSLRLAHPALGNVRFIGPTFNIGRAPMNGSAHTVMQSTPRLGPSLRFIADTSNWDNSLISLPGGQSGHIASGHYKDLWKDYYNGKASKLMFTNVEESSTLRLTPQAR